MVVILDIFPPEEEIVEDVDDILDFFKPKEEKPLEATFPFPVETPLTKSEIVGTKSVSDVFKNKEKQPSALMATSPSIETPLPKSGVVGRRRPVLDDLCDKENQPLAKLFPKNVKLVRKTASEIMEPNEKHRLASMATPPSIKTIMPKNGRFVRKPASEVVNSKEKQRLASVATPPSIKAMLPRNGRFVRKTAPEFVEPKEKQRMASVATPPSIKTK